MYSIIASVILLSFSIIANGESSSTNESISPVFKSPYRYIGLSIEDAAKQASEKQNSGGNVVVNNEEAHMLLEHSGNIIGFVDIELKKAGTCWLYKGFDSKPLLNYAGVNVSELELVNVVSHLHVYYDHNRKLKVSVVCENDGGNFFIRFSKKYYKM